MVRGKKWYGYFRRTVLDPAANEPKPTITPVVLGLKSEMTKFEAREKLEREIVRLTGHTTEEGVVRNGSVTLHWFVHNRYLPLKEAGLERGDGQDQKALDRSRYARRVWRNPVGTLRQARSPGPPQQAGKNPVQGQSLACRAYIRSIFAEAVDQDFLLKDPARKLKTPVNLRDTDKTVLTWDQLRSRAGRTRTPQPDSAET